MVCEAIKTAIYASACWSWWVKAIPRYCEDHNDIVTCFDADTADALIGFCRGIQAAQPRGQLCRTGTLSGAGLYR